VLRVNPGRVEVYLRLAHLHARKNVASESKRNLLEYIERMNTLGKLDDAFRQVQVFADQHAGNQDIRLMLVDLLRAASRTKEAETQLEKIATELEARGDRAGARRTRERLHAHSADDAEGDSDTGAAAAPSAPGGLVFLETGYEPPVFAKPFRAAAHAAPPVPEAPVEPMEPVAGFETVGGAEADAAPVDEAPVAGLDTFEPPALPGDSDGGEALADLESAEFTVPDAEPVPAEPLDGLVLDDASELSAEAANESGLELENLPAAGAEDVPPDEPRMSMDAALEMPLESMPQERATPADESLDFDVGLVDDSSAYTISLPTEEPDTEGLLDGFTGGQVRYLDDFDVGDDVGGGAADLEAESEPVVETEPVAKPGSVAGDEPPSIEALEDRILDDPDDPVPHLELAQLLSAEGDGSRAAEEFLIAVQAFETRHEWDAALDASDRLLALQPDEIGHQQKRVELAYRSGDRHRLMTAYLGLADALVRSGESVKAAAVYQRVLEHDPGNATARDAIEWLSQTAEPAVAPAVEPPKAAPPANLPPPPEGFVDFGAMVIDAEGPRDTRMRVDKEDPTGDEQKDFLETLAQFKKGIEANLGSEDYEAHYDLGVAFKEMGLLDEAIAEFQKALRAPNGRLRTSEALGVTFFEKQQYAIAETILHRAVEALAGGDDEKIGLLYWLGRACEAQRKLPEARSAYERALAVDIRFMDLSVRIHKLSAGHSA
jgi:tetratricopeptide (TPR) repeat protein